MTSALTCKVHPVVLLSVIDSYERRSQKENKAIGTLLGVYDKKVIEVSNCYSVPFSESKNEPELDDVYNRNVYQIIRKTGSEIPVGWFSTSEDIVDHTLSYHDYYSEFVRVTQEKREAPPVVLLTLDASLETGRMGLKAYIRTKAGIPGAENPHCAIFIPIQVDLALFDTEETCLNVVSTGTDNPRRIAKLWNGVEQIKNTSEEMLEWIKQIKVYVDEVLAGKRNPDSAVGRKLMELVNSVGKIQPQQFEQMINSSIKDFLMVSYLAQLAKTQLTLHEKMLQA